MSMPRSTQPQLPTCLRGLPLSYSFFTCLPPRMFALRKFASRWVRVLWRQCCASSCR